MLEIVKTALRLKTAVFDAEINSLIASCKADLRVAGINIPDEDTPRRKRSTAKAPDNDPLIERAVILYCKGNFGYTEGGERYVKAYDLLKSSLCLAGDYNAVE